MYIENTHLYKKHQVAIKENVDLTEQNQCGFWILQIENALNQLKNLDAKFVVCNCY